MATDETTRRGLLKLLGSSAPGSPDDVTKDSPPPHLQPLHSRVHAELDLAERFFDHGEIARGGMAIVHRVLERTLNRIVALKVLKPEKAFDDNARRRFIAEAQITGQLEHPYIVPVYEIGEDDAQQVFFTMKLVEGRTLQDFIEKQEPETHDDALSTAVDAVLKVADALSFAHARGVIHRDVKPANVMIGDHGEVYLMDWGIARVPNPGPAPAAHEKASERKTTSLTAFAFEREGMVLGTYAFMSPEQARGDVEGMNPRTDVFGLGAMLFRIVSGEPPIQGKTPLDALANAGSSKVVDVADKLNGRLRRALLDVALQAMRPQQADRFASASAFRRAVEGVLRGGTRFPIQKLQAGSVIVQEGSQGTDAYIVRTGSCEVSHGKGADRVVLQRLDPGAVFGETAVFTGQPRNATVIAVTDVELWVVPGAVLQEELGLDTWLGAFVRSLGARFTERSSRVTQLEATLKKEQLARAAYARLARTDAPVPLSDLAQALGMDAARARELLEDTPGLKVTSGPDGRPVVVLA
jgi:eukaryotic-like serine/threonine-protein kinase